MAQGQLQAHAHKAGLESIPFLRGASSSAFFGTGPATFPALPLRLAASGVTNSYLDLAYGARAFAPWPIYVIKSVPVSAKCPQRFVKCSWNRCFRANLVPMVSHLRLGGKMRDPGNEVVFARSGICLNELNIKNNGKNGFDGMRIILSVLFSNANMVKLPQKVR